LIFTAPAIFFPSLLSNIMLFPAPKMTKFPLPSMIFFLFRQNSHILQLNQSIFSGQYDAKFRPHRNMILRNDAPMVRNFLHFHMEFCNKGTPFYRFQSVRRNSRSLSYFSLNHSKNRNPREIPCLLFDINIPQCFYHTYTPFCVNTNHRIAAQGIEPCQIKPCQPLSNLQFLITEGFSVSNNTATIHKSPIDRNYCSSTRLSGDKELMWRGFEPRRKDLLPHNVPEKYFLCIAFCNRHFIAFTHSATHQRPILGKRSV
jgi:hypothetical protein